MLSFLAAAALNMAGAPPAPEPAPLMNVEPAARDAVAVVDRFHASLHGGDGKAALALLGDDVLVYESGHVELDKAEYREMHLDADMEYSKAVTEVVTRRAAHAVGDMAWVASEGRTSGSFRGKAVDRATTETILLRRTGGEWRIVHIHWSSAH